MPGLPLAWSGPLQPDHLPLGFSGGWMQAWWLWRACEGVSAWSPGSLQALTCTPCPPVLPAGLVVQCLVDDLASPDPVETASIFALPSVLGAFGGSAFIPAGPKLPLQTQAACSEAEGLAALSLIPRASGHQSPAGSILLFLLLAAGVFSSFCCTHLCRFLNVVF